MNGYLKDEFVTWMGKQKKSNGEKYSNNTILQYTSSLKNTTAKFGNLDIKDTDLFNYDNLEEFEKVHNILKLHPRFEEVDKSAGNKAYSNGMKMYLRFLKERQGIVSVELDDDALEDDFEWTEFYIKLADEILKYKNNREKLLNILNTIFKITGIKNSLFKGEEALRDICPFTVFGIFNKGSDINRNKLLQQFAVEFGITESVPATFAGIPVLNPMMAWLFAGNAAIDNGDIDNLWELFEAAIKFADGEEEKKNNVIKYYNKVITQKCAKWNVTMGLYWIRPWDYLPLDDRTRKYCKKYNIYAPLGETIGGWKQPPNGELYLEIIDKLKNNFAESEDNKLVSFPQLSLIAWLDGTDESYRPSLEEYNHGISKDDWLELIKNEKIFGNSAKEVMHMFLKQNGECTCSKLADIYGRSWNYYNSICVNIAEKVYKETECGLFEGGENYKYWPILFQGKEIKEDGKKRFLWKLRPELLEALEESDLPEIVIVGKNEENQHWWLNANPKFWSFSEIGIGEEVEWTLYNDNGNKRRIFQNFIDAKEGDLVIGYESSPIKQIVALGRVSRENDGNFLYIEKTENLSNPIEFNDVKENDELQEMEYIVNPNGSFFKLKIEEYNVLMDMIREQNPLLKDEKKDIYDKENFLREVYMSSDDYDILKSLVKRKKNIILQGAPGVGKTFAAKRLAYSIMGCEDDSRVLCVQFHQSYSYEDFIMGYKPYEEGFKLETGIFYNFCKKAENNPSEPFFFIIDEINRGNLSKIFGELLMLIENDKRGQKMTLAYNGMLFSVPENLYIIGMMNTADRSLAIIDYALRRRFSFYSINPAFESEGFKEYQKKLNNIKFQSLITVVQELNENIINDASLGEGFVIGHSYFCGENVCTDNWIKEIIEYDLIPILQEYWFDDNSKAKLWANKMRGVLND